jgi:hypothetical protein
MSDSEVDRLGDVLRVIIIALFITTLYELIQRIVHYR